MSELQELFARQSAWQKQRRELSWPEKIRMAEALRESVSRLRRSPTLARPQRPPPVPGKAEPPQS